MIHPLLGEPRDYWHLPILEKDQGGQRLEPSLPAAWPPKSGSFEKMFLTQPPATEVFCAIRAC